MSDDVEFQCAVCLEIIEKAVSLPCSHLFCTACIDGVIDASGGSRGSQGCPQCRETFSRHDVTRRKDVDSRIQATSTQCTACGKTMTMNKMRAHTSTCKKTKLAPVASSAPDPERASATPNRSTFKCPYCSVKNLDCQGLVKHCNDKHAKSDQKVVCPVCASMPWGDPNLKSSSFIAHLNQRHTFEYDTYVDFEQDDEAMLQAALQASLADS